MRYLSVDPGSARAQSRPRVRPQHCLGSGTKGHRHMTEHMHAARAGAQRQMSFITAIARELDRALAIALTRTLVVRKKDKPKNCAEAIFQFLKEKDIRYL